MKFSLMFFSAAAAGYRRYEEILQIVELADSSGIWAVWTPERHFTKFGGAYPNPAVLSAALAARTKTLRVRGGSVVAPLHDVIRIAEDWAVVDLLSSGRAGLSLASGWNADDFVFFPDRYETRHEMLYLQVEELRRIWRGESLIRRNGKGTDIEVSVSVLPIQDPLPLWVSSKGRADTFEQAGTQGVNVLTHLVEQTVEELRCNVRSYRLARKNAGYVAQEGTVTVMLHTFLQPSVESARKLAAQPLRAYLDTVITMGGVRGRPGASLPRTKLRDELLDLSVERYLNTASLIGSIDTCTTFVQELKEADVDEIACLIDFGVSHTELLSSLEFLLCLCQVHTK